MAICTTSNTSRTRQSVVPTLLADPVDPALTISIRIGAKYLPHRDRAEEKSAHQGQQQSDQVDRWRPGSRHMHGKLGKRLPCAQARNRTTLPNSPRAPPTSEISTASVKSRAECACGSIPARAAEQLRGSGRRRARQTGCPGWRRRPAESTPPAASIPSRNALTAAAKQSPARPGRASEKLMLAIVFGIGLLQIGADRVQVGNRLRRSDSRLQMPQHHRRPSGFRAAFRNSSPPPVPDSPSAHRNRERKNNSVP